MTTLPHRCAHPGGSVTRRISTKLATAFVSLSVVLASCSGGDSPDRDTDGVPADPGAVRIAASQATVLELGSGARLIIPPGAMTEGATVRATYRHPPSGTSNNMHHLADPIELISEPPDAIHGLLTLEFPVDPTELPAGVDPAMAFGISTFDTDSKHWMPFTSTYDASRRMVVAQIPHFSWWNPFSWDWAGIGARINQDVGQALGRRAGEATCNSGPPSWVNTTAGITNDAAIAVRACLQSEGDVLDVQLVNNRSYGMVLTYGAPVKWGWHQEATSAVGQARNHLADQLIDKQTQLYLPPLGRASVGIPRFRPGANVVFNIGVTWASLIPDIGEEIAGNLLPKIPQLGPCGAYLLSNPIGGLSPSALRDLFVKAGNCLLTSYKDTAKSGALDRTTVAQLEATVDGLAKAKDIGLAWSVWGYSWRVPELWTDAVIATKGGALGAGFSVLSRAQPPDTSPITPPTPQQPPPIASPQAEPNPPQPPASRGFFIQDDVYGGTWARSDPSDGTWYNSGTRPHNARYWFNNGLGVAIDCTRHAAPYRVKLGQQTQTWSWWAHVTDNTWIPVAVFPDVNTDGDLGLAHC